MTTRKTLCGLMSTFFKLGNSLEFVLVSCLSAMARAFSRSGRRGGKSSGLVGWSAVGLVVLSCLGASMMHSGPGRSASGTAEVGKKEAARTSLAKLPVYFIKNQGQIDARAAYYVQGQGLNVYFGRDGVMFAFTSPSKQPPTPESLLRPAALKTEPAPLEGAGTARR